MSKKKDNIRYVGKIPVSLYGASGLIQPNQTLFLPEEKVSNLVLDENWERVDIAQPLEKKEGKKPNKPKGGK